MLWEHLRGGQINGLKLRRQHPIGRFITDFCCPKAKLIVEIDGSVHIKQADYDLARTQALEAQGCRVIRFTNTQIITKLNSVLQTPKTLTTNSPSPAGGRAAPGAAGRGEGQEAL